MANDIKIMSGLKPIDISELVNKHSNTPIMRSRIFFLAESTKHTSDEDNEFLRTGLGIRTVIDTEYPSEPSYTLDNNTSSTYTKQTCTVDKFLGLTSCHAFLRYGNYARNVLNEMPSAPRRAFMKAADRSPNDPSVIKQGQKLTALRNPVYDAFAVLRDSMATIARIFTEVLTGLCGHPLLICGPRTNYDSSIMVFLVLLAFDLRGDVLHHVLEDLMEDMTPEGGFQEKGMASWARELALLVDQNYGSAEGYFRAAGLTQECLSRIKEDLLLEHPASEHILVKVDA